MSIEKRRYKIKGFRDDGEKLRVLLTPADIVKTKDKDMSSIDVLKNPMGIAEKMMNQQMSKIINDSFSISHEEYRKKKYLVGEFVIVTIERE